MFGSNEAGIHGAGAAKLALDKFGAEYNRGFGFYGQSFAIPTKDYSIRTLSLDRIKYHIMFFEDFANNNPNLVFLVTEIGCGLAGYSPEDIAPLFESSYRLSNVYMPKRFWDVHFNKNKTI